MSKKRILILIDWFYPAFKAGGPIRSVFNLVQFLKNDFDFFILSSNQEIDGSVITVEPNKWIDSYGVKVNYLDQNNRSIENYRKLQDEVKADFIYLNSMFSFSFTIKPFFAYRKSNVQVVLAPRGMLGEASLKIKPLKKKVFLSIFSFFLKKKKNFKWHATSTKEIEDIQKYMGKNVNVVMAPNLPMSLSSKKGSSLSKQEGKLKMVFLSRIHPIKNLHFLLEVLSELNDEDIELDIYGPIEDKGYWERCNIYIENSSAINYKGTIQPLDIPELYQQYHAYVSPSLHENYGHSIVEAMLSSLWVIISDKTPWRNISGHGIGMDLSLNDKESWKRAIIQLKNKSHANWVEDKKRMKEFCESRLLNDKNKEKYIELFNFN